MPFHSGDTLLFKGYSGIYKTVKVLMPTQAQTVSFNFTPCTDAYGNSYATVQIGTQLWMAENLKTAKYSNGDAIPNVTDNTQWSMLSTGAYCHYDNLTSNASIYGELYNWFAAADIRNICPNGWHVSTYDEWKILIITLGDSNIAGGKLKDNCSSLWVSPNKASNESGFTARPNGGRDIDGSYFNITYSSGWLTSTEYWGDPTYTMYFGIGSYDAYIYSGYGSKPGGGAVRCIIN